MELAQEKSTPIAITVARHAAGMAVIALANPLIYFDSSPFEAWAMLPVGAAIIAAVLFGVLALISPERARVAWPYTPIKSAWLILVLMLLANWQDYRARPVENSDQPSEVERFLSDAPQPGLKPFHGKLDGE